jgi:predicted flap endonuclease-1-like 5' DNA nuclease
VDIDRCSGVDDIVVLDAADELMQKLPSLEIKKQEQERKKKQREEEKQKQKEREKERIIKRLKERGIDNNISTELDLQDVEYVGPTTARKLKEIGILSPVDLAVENCEELSVRLNCSEETAVNFITAAQKLLQEKLVEQDK